MRIHLIACGGAVMHNMTIALKQLGHEVTGSDDEIYDPAKSRLKEHGLLPDFGWNTERITKNIDVIILGMHAKQDNPELLKALELGIKVVSYPEYLYELSKNKKRVVIGGSHGKTSITSMVLHVLQYHNQDFDYMVGAQIEGFDTMVKITDAPLIILEGDEYLASPLDRRPKFHLYKADIAVLTGIAWDHVNVFPTFENYVEQFEIFIDSLADEAKLFTFQGDEILEKIRNRNKKIFSSNYNSIEHKIENGYTSIVLDGKDYPINIFGSHNMQNLQAAQHICIEIGLSPMQFVEAIQHFTGAAKRLDLLAESPKNVVYKDFAHSPSKLKATVSAMKEQFPSRTLVGCMELHTFSSLTKSFLKEYKGAMDACDEAIVFINKRYFEIKNLEAFSENDVKAGFEREDLKVYFDAEELKNELNRNQWDNSNLLLMSSGNFGNIDLQEIANKVVQ